MTDHRRSNFDDGDMRLLGMREANYPGGVVVDPIPITLGEEITVLYYGLLPQSGADQVWMHCGYGDANNWHNVQDIKMEWTERGFAKKIKINDGSRFNFCFKDSANNWDNNNGLNWSFEVHNGQQI
ncbi:carbohydrate-binding protein [Zhaonella formicivorans]|uniref:carbohydrate-binding protein n=1 Tax=Zhaonella formicivorans TaxID=2528593 RepID=UPI0010CE1A9A|nr:carbohydrate-binding protein [Zhaonella formicivorans]